MNPIIIYTDGAAKGNPGPAGWAWWHAPHAWAAGGWPHATNNQAELTAVVQALHAVDHLPEAHLTIVTDSRYVIDSCTNYIHNWKRNNWKTSKNTPVANADVIRLIDHLTTRRTHPVTWTWVKGHSTSHGNNQADEAASAAALAHQQHTTIPAGPGWGPPPPQQTTAAITTPLHPL